MQVPKRLLESGARGSPPCAPGQDLQIPLCTYYLDSRQIYRFPFVLITWISGKFADFPLYLLPGFSEILQIPLCTYYLDFGKFPDFPLYLLPGLFPKIGGARGEESPNDSVPPIGGPGGAAPPLQRTAAPPHPSPPR